MQILDNCKKTTFWIDIWSYKNTVCIIYAEKFYAQNILLINAKMKSNIYKN